MQTGGLNLVLKETIENKDKERSVSHSFGVVYFVGEIKWQLRRAYQRWERQANGLDIS